MFKINSKPCFIFSRKGFICKMILIIGSTSFIGLPVVKKLLDKNYKIKCMVRTNNNISEIKNAANSRDMEIIFNLGDLCRQDSIFNNLKEVNTVIYLIDLKNISFIKNFIKAAERTTLKRVIFVSSTTVLLPIQNKIKEDKLVSENLIKNSGLDYTILRPAMIYGSKNDGNFSKMINFIKKRGFFLKFGSGNNLIQPIHIDDVAEAVIAVIETGTTLKKIYEICGKEPLSYNEMLKITGIKMRKPFKIIRMPIKFSKFLIAIYIKIFKKSQLTADMIERMKVDKTYSYDEAKKDFNFSPIGFAEGIEKLIKELET